MSGQFFEGYLEKPGFADFDKEYKKMKEKVPEGGELSHNMELPVRYHSPRVRCHGFGPGVCPECMSEAIPGTQVDPSAEDIPTELREMIRLNPGTKAETQCNAFDMATWVSLSYELVGRITHSAGLSMGALPSGGKFGDLTELPPGRYDFPTQYAELPAVFLLGGRTAFPKDYKRWHQENSTPIVDLPVNLCIACPIHGPIYCYAAGGMEKIVAMFVACEGGTFGVDMDAEVREYDPDDLLLLPAFTNQSSAQKRKIEERATMIIPRGVRGVLDYRERYDPPTAGYILVANNMSSRGITTSLAPKSDESLPGVTMVFLPYENSEEAEILREFCEGRAELEYLCDQASQYWESSTSPGRILREAIEQDTFSPAQDVAIIFNHTNFVEDYEAQQGQIGKALDALNSKIAESNEDE